MLELLKFILEKPDRIGGAFLLLVIAGIVSVVLALIVGATTVDVAHAIRDARRCGCRGEKQRDEEV